MKDHGAPGDPDGHHDGDHDDNHDGDHDDDHHYCHDDYHDGNDVNDHDDKGRGLHVAQSDIFVTFLRLCLRFLIHS